MLSLGWFFLVFQLYGDPEGQRSPRITISLILASSRMLNMKKVNHMLADLIWSIKTEKSSKPENFLYWGKILIVPSLVIPLLFEAVKFPPAENNINCALSVCESLSQMLFKLIIATRTRWGGRPFVPSPRALSDRQQNLKALKLERFGFVFTKVLLLKVHRWSRCNGRAFQKYKILALPTRHWIKMFTLPRC